jgi:CBS domain-containing membrane protein
MMWQNKYLHIREIIFSSLGAFVAIAILTTLAHYIPTKGTITLPILASMGASACLIFAIPHSPLAQPWPVFGGHLFSAAVGVFCSQFIFNIYIAAATAVALSIVVMQIMRCLHPPSAATALIAVLGGAEIHSLGWQFCYEVVVINVTALVLLALAINQLIPNRRYPINHLYSLNHGHSTQLDLLTYTKLNEHDFKWALEQMDGVIDVTEEDLVELHEFAQVHAKSRS